jgi:hypothetical protein
MALRRRGHAQEHRYAFQARVAANALPVAAADNRRMRQRGGHSVRELLAELADIVVLVRHSRYLVRAIDATD